MGLSPLLSSNGIKAELSLREWRQVCDVLKKEKEKVAPEVSAARKAYVAEHANPTAAQKLNVSEKRLRSLWNRAVEHRVLTSDFVLHREDGTTVTVGEVLSDAEKWHQARFADPLEPDYRNDKRIAYLNLEPEEDSEPYLYSHAHGGMRFRLVREAAKITLKKGERARVLDTTLTIIRGRGDVFERGGEMVKMAGNAILPFNDPRLSDYLSRHIRFTEMKLIKGEWMELAADPPNWLCQQLNAKAGERGLRDLRAIITAPILRPDGSLLCTPGYDEATGLLLKAGSWPRIPEAPTKSRTSQGIRDAVETLC